MREMLRVAMMKAITGKAIVYAAFAYMQAVCLFVLAYHNPALPWAGFAIALAAVNTPFYGGGALANHSDKTAGAPK